MAEEDSRDCANDSNSLFELESESDGVMHPCLFEPQHSTSSEDESGSNMAQDAPEAVKAIHDHVLATVAGVPALIA